MSVVKFLQSLPADSIFRFPLIVHCTLMSQQLVALVTLRYGIGVKI